MILYGNMYRIEDVGNYTKDRSIAATYYGVLNVYKKADNISTNTPPTSSIEGDGAQTESSQPAQTEQSINEGY